MLGKISSGIYNLKIPSALLKNEKCRFYPIFSGITTGLLEFSCHLSTHAKGHSPHELHKHNEEEILFLLSGNARLIHRVDDNFSKNRNIDLKKGQFVYYPSNFPHTFISTGDTPANFLALQWKTNSKNKKHGQGPGYFTIPEQLRSQENKKFIAETLFEFPTLYLNKLHCHTSIISPGGSIKTHRDLYDVVSIIIEGEMETLGKKAKLHDVIFYPTGKPHGLQNNSNKRVREIVFEFHTNKVISIDKIPYLLKYYFKILTKLKFWKKRFKTILKIILPEFFIEKLKKRYRQ